MHTISDVVGGVVEKQKAAFFLRPQELPVPIVANILPGGWGRMEAADDRRTDGTAQS